MSIDSFLIITLPTAIASLDAMSATCLLERYVEDEGWGSLQAEPCSFPPPKDLEIFDYDIVRKHIKGLYYSDTDSKNNRNDDFSSRSKHAKVTKKISFAFQNN